MVIVDLNSVQLWTPSFNPFLDKQQKASSYSNARSVYKTTSSQNQPASLYDKADQIFKAGVQDRDNAHANCDDEVDEEFPSIEELWRQNSRHEILTKYQDSTDILQHPEESALNTSGSRLSPENSDNSTGNSQGTRDKPVILEDDESDTPDPEATAEPSKSIDPPGHGPWWDVEDGCFVDDDLRPIPSLEQKGLASTPAQGQLHSHHHPPGPSHPSIDQEHDQSGTGYGRLEELEHCSPLRSQDQEEPQEQQQQDVVDTMREDDYDYDEEWRHQDEAEEINSSVHQSESSDYSHDTNDEDDGDPRPAKRQKLSLAHTVKAVTPPREHSQTPRLTPSSTMQPEIDEARSQAEHGHLPTSADDEHHHTPRTSRSPSAPAESALVAEYQEWPFQGFLKRTKIGNETTYNLEFQLPHVPEHLHLPVLSEALGMRSNKETSAEAATPHTIVAHSKVWPATLQSKRKRVPWKPEENETILKMKKEGCSWEVIRRALPDRTLGAIQVQYSTKLKK